MAQETGVHQDILCIALASKRLAHVLIDERDEIIDFGVREVSGTDKQKMLAHFDFLLECYEPKTVYLQDISDEHCRLGDAARRVARAIECRLKKLEVETIRVTKDQVWAALDLERKTPKEVIARIIADRQPRLAKLLPPPRKIWTAEHKHMPIFVAASLGIINRSLSEQ